MSMKKVPYRKCQYNYLYLLLQKSGKGRNLRPDEEGIATQAIEK